MTSTDVWRSRTFGDCPIMKLGTRITLLKLCRLLSRDQVPRSTIITPVQSTAHAMSDFKVYDNINLDCSRNFHYGTQNALSFRPDQPVTSSRAPHYILPAPFVPARTSSPPNITMPLLTFAGEETTGKRLHRPDELANNTSRRSSLAHGDNTSHRHGWNSSRWQLRRNQTTCTIQPMTQDRSSISSDKISTRSGPDFLLASTKDLENLNQRKHSVLHFKRN